MKKLILFFLILLALPAFSVYEIVNQTCTSTQQGSFTQANLLLETSDSYFLTSDKNVYQAPKIAIGTWTLKGSIPYRITQLVNDPATNTLYAAGTPANDGWNFYTYKSVDQGVTWTLVGTPINSLNYFLFYRVNSLNASNGFNKIYSLAGVPLQWYEIASLEEGTQIRAITSGNFQEHAVGYKNNIGTLYSGPFLNQLTARGSLPENEQPWGDALGFYDGNLFMITQNNEGKGSVFRSMNSGNTWEKVFTQDMAFTEIAGKPETGINVLASNGNIFRSWNGTTWISLGTSGFSPMGELLSPEAGNYLLAVITGRLNQVICNAWPMLKVKQKNISAAPGATVTLDVSDSTDLENHTIQYTWNFSSGPLGAPAPVLNNSATAIATAIMPNQTGEYFFEIRLKDNGSPAILPAQGSADLITVTVQENQAPTANAGPDIQCTINQNCTVQGIGTDPENQSLEYNWNLALNSPQGPIQTVGAEDQTNYTFTAAQIGTYILTFAVTDNANQTAKDQVTITMVSDQVNHAPIVNAGPDVLCVINEECTLVGQASDPDNDELNYFWTPEVMPGNAIPAQPPISLTLVFTANTIGNYTFKLTAQDREDLDDPNLLEASDTVNVIMFASQEELEAANQVPIANAGVNQIVHTGEIVQLNGNQSSDPEGQTINYAWTQVSGPLITIQNGNQMLANFTPTQIGTYVFRLSVTDSLEASANDDISIQVLEQISGTQTVCGNNVCEEGENVVSCAFDCEINSSGERPGFSVPFARAGRDQNVEEGDFVILDGSTSSDADEQALAFEWEQTSGETVAIINADRSKAIFVAGETGTEYEFKLTVTDESENTATDLVKVKVETVTARRTTGSGQNPTDTTVNAGNTLGNTCSGTVCLGFCYSGQGICCTDGWHSNTETCQESGALPIGNNVDFNLGTGGMPDFLSSPIFLILTAVSILGGIIAWFLKFRKKEPYQKKQAI
ncbi:MAG: PKD domain-containing protein [Candidatus Diapherotrites archaeon]|nr:PKD domain-containing protein [Candidatus Diapherotrites archaeon]